MTRKEENFIIDSNIELLEYIRSPAIRQLIKETHENNIMLKSIITAINTYIKHHPQENQNDFVMNIIANLISNGVDKFTKINGNNI